MFPVTLSVQLFNNLERNIYYRHIYFSSYTTLICILLNTIEILIHTIRRFLLTSSLCILFLVGQVETY